MWMEERGDGPRRFPDLAMRAPQLHPLGVELLVLFHQRFPNLQCHACSREVLLELRVKHGALVGAVRARRGWLSHLALSPPSSPA